MNTKTLLLSVASVLAAGTVSEAQSRSAPVTRAAAAPAPVVVPAVAVPTFDPFTLKTATQPAETVAPVETQARPPFRPPVRSPFRPPGRGQPF